MLQPILFRLKHRSEKVCKRWILPSTQQCPSHLHPARVALVEKAVASSQRFSPRHRPQQTSSQKTRGSFKFSPMECKMSSPRQQPPPPPQSTTHTSASQSKAVQQTGPSTKGHPQQPHQIASASHSQTAHGSQSSSQCPQSSGATETARAQQCVQMMSTSSTHWGGPRTESVPRLVPFCGVVGGL